MDTLSSTRVESSKVKIPEPKAFSAARSAKELENFIWDMEQYFTAARVPDADKLNITTMYCRVMQNIGGGIVMQMTWVLVVLELIHGISL